MLYCAPYITLADISGVAASPNLQMQSATSTDHELAIYKRAMVMQRPAEQGADPRKSTNVKLLCPSPAIATKPDPPLFASPALAQMYTLYLVVITTL